MPFFDPLKSYLPESLTPSTAYYTRASFGAIAAYAATINPIAGVVVLLGHGAWECAGYFLQSHIDRQQQRIDCYNDAFSALVVRAQELGTECTEKEIENARNIFFVHNLIEEICYKALADAVLELGLRSDSITEAQSGYILAYVKKAAHVELRKEGGYSKTGRNMVTSAQLDGVIQNVATIIHDRDGRLTDARYFTLTDLCTAIDDHNSYVKNVLFRSWFRCRALSSDTHLNMIKDLVDFNERMSSQLGFNFKQRLEARKRYYDTMHPTIREVVCSKTGEKSALKFVNLTEVRTKFAHHLDVLLHCEPDAPLLRCLVDYGLFSKDEALALCQERILPCAARFGFASSAKTIAQPPLINEPLTVSEFLGRYFPEVCVKDKADTFSSLKPI